MNRILATATPLLAAVILVAGPAAAVRHVTCQQIQSALASGKKVAEVAKELKVSTRRVEHCKSASISAENTTGGGSKSTKTH